MLLYTGNITSNAFGGLLSAAILTDLNGKLGVAGWRYLFYIEGIFSYFATFVSDIDHKLSGAITSAHTAATYASTLELNSNM